jgi:hypothetical protein
MNRHDIVSFKLARRETTAAALLHWSVRDAPSCRSHLEQRGSDRCKEQEKGIKNNQDKAQDFVQIADSPTQAKNLVETLDSRYNVEKLKQVRKLLRGFHSSSQV